jgi:hypothetical protein
MTYRAIWKCKEGRINPFPVSNTAYNIGDLGDDEKKASLICSICSSHKTCDGLEIVIEKGEPLK